VGGRGHLSAGARLYLGGWPAGRVLQVVTQIQDMSLTFIPKLVATVFALILFGPWMLRKLLRLATELIANIPNYF